MPCFTEEELASNPSMRDGVPLQLFEDVRAQCVAMAFAVSQRLEFPLLVAGRASLLFQQFYQQRSLLRNDRFVVIMACIYVATKVEGRQKNVKDIIIACFDHRYDKAENPIRCQSNKAGFIEEVVKGVQQVEEVLLLQITNFDFEEITIYGAAFRLLSQLTKIRDKRYQHMQQLMCAMINDSMYTPICLIHSGKDVARGIVMMALRLARMEVLIENNMDKIWEGAEEKRAPISKAVTNMMANLYDFSDADPKVEELSKQEG
ncbi:hypothetical protein BSKO_06267 [Bryopsis sp. KO-2023]|nr:hypothetical protein BSKO_06267 [Bryopsis sp. KO-2023]